MPPVVHIIWNALYNASKIPFALVGLQPIDGLYAIGAVFLMGLSTQLWMLTRQRDSWSFDPKDTPRKRDFQG